MYVNVMLDKTGLHMFVTEKKPRGYVTTTTAELNNECCVVQPEVVGEILCSCRRNKKAKKAAKLSLKMSVK